MATFFLKRGSTPDNGLPIGTTWVFDKDDVFNPPADGDYMVELHGGGGGYSFVVNDISNGSKSGGGSGELQTFQLTKGETIPITIGLGGASEGGRDSIGVQGGASTFGSYLSVDGGGGAYYYQGGDPSGNIATAGGVITSPGLGNMNNPSQKYGNGGGQIDGSFKKGENGACIITYVGKR